jgi:membrane protease YdiL (CAAX protease family)
VTGRKRASRLEAACFWGGAAGLLVLLRYRRRIGVFRDLHEWLAEIGVAPWARNIDNDILLVALGVLLWAVLRWRSGGEGGLPDDLGLRGNAKGGLVGLLLALPMLLLGAATGGGISFSAPMVRLVLTGPFAEEWFFRGVLVLAFVKRTEGRFWRPAIGSGVLFGLMHVAWTGEGFAVAWPHLLMTTAGGIWFAWLARAWGRNLWVAIFAHMLMNLASYWYRPHESWWWWHEVGRGATIVLGTVMTIRPSWFGMGRVR